MSSWGYVALGYLLSVAAIAAFAWQTERRIAGLRRLLRTGGNRR